MYITVGLKLGIKLIRFLVLLGLFLLLQGRALVVLLVLLLLGLAALQLRPQPSNVLVGIRVGRGGPGLLFPATV